jgi:photosystem II stability/assembly factor-like uncharacterized protein
VALAAVLAAGAALYAGGDGIGAGDARSAEDDPASAATLDRAGSWSVPTGPPGFSADIVLHPTNQGWLYLAAGGRVYRSTDGGRSWKSGPPIARKLDALTVDPRHGSTLYAGSNDGVLKSTDGGRTWRRSGLRPPPGRLYFDGEGWVISIAVDPADSRNVYAITWGREKTVAFRSRDAGATWQAMRPSISRDMREIHAAGAGVLYTAGDFYWTIPNGVRRSLDGGTTWQGVLDGNWSLALDPDRAETVWAVGERGLRVTRDGGASWQSPGPAPARDLSRIVLDPRRPSTLYLSTQQNGVFRSLDGGRTWRPFGSSGKGRPGRRPHLTELVAIDPRKSGTLYAGDGFGVVATANGGASWRRADAGVVASRVTSVTPAPSSPATLYAASRVLPPRWVAFSTSLSRSDDRGRTWIRLRADDASSLAVDPSDRRHVLVGGRRGIFGSRDGGVTWTSHLRLPNVSVSWITFAASDPRQVYAWVFTIATEQNVLYRSNDGGTTWSAQPGSRFQGIMGFAVHPTRADTVYAGYESLQASPGGGVAISSDGGRSWRYRPTPGEVPGSLAIAPSDPDTIYAAIGWGVARSVDGGDSWLFLPRSGPMSGTVQTLAVDPKQSKIVYVGTYGHGVLRSMDGGATWRPFGARRLPRQDVQTLAFDPTGTLLYAGASDAGLTSIRVR